MTQPPSKRLVTEAALEADVAAKIGAHGLIDGALAAGFVPRWQAATAVASGEVRMAPDGHTIQSNSARTTRSSYDATEQSNWAVIGDSRYAPAPTGTPDGTKFYADDHTWKVPPGSGGGSSIDALDSARAKFEGRPLWLTGHSYVGSTGHSTLRFWERIQKRLNMSADSIMDAIGGTRLAQHSMSVLGGTTAYPLNSGRCAMACGSLNWPGGVVWNDSFAKAHEYSWRSIIAAVSARAAVAASTSSFVFSSGSWSKIPATNASTGGFIWTTSHVGDYFKFSYTDAGTGCDVFLRASSSGAGLVTFTEGATTLGTLDLTAATYDTCSAIFRIRGLSAGNHTITGTLTSGASLTVDGYRIPSEQPAPVVVFLEGGLAASFETANPGANADLDNARPITASVVAEFPNAVLADARPEWDSETMTYDGIHPNDRGEAVFTQKGIAAMATLGWSKGGHLIDQNWPPTYTPPTPPATPSGGYAGTDSPAPSRTNWVTNPSFEAGTAGWFVASGDVMANDGTPHSGSKAGRLIDNSGSSHYFSYGNVTVSGIPVTPGEPFSASAYIRLATGSTSTPANVSVTFWTSGGGYTGTTTTGSNITPTTTHQRASATGTVPATSAYANIVIHFDAPSVEWQVDDVLYEKTSTVGTYFDGDTPGAYWSGSTQASTSYIP